jgi:hypothetical protein
MPSALQNPTRPYEHKDFYLCPVLDLPQEALLEELFPGELLMQHVDHPNIKISTETDL